MTSEKQKDVLIREEGLQGLIYTLRGVQVMLDSDLAELYGVETKNLNRAVSRNSDRFPDEFRFQLTKEEAENLRSQFVTSIDGHDLRFQNGTSSLVSQKAIPDGESLRSQNATLSGGHGGRRYLPYVFTEQGVAMLSAVLHSETAIQTSIHIINAFVGMRRFLIANGGLLQRMDSLEKRQAVREIQTDERFEEVFKALEYKRSTPAQGVFFDGQIFDAYVFVNDLLRQAKKSIVLIDNYVDDTVLEQLAKRRANVRAVILTRKISKTFAQDLEKHNAQYPPVTVREFDRSHDRFLILDGETVYHLGASLKDLGKKWFAFSKLDKAALSLMGKVGEILGEEIETA